MTSADAQVRIFAENEHEGAEIALQGDEIDSGEHIGGLTGEAMACAVGLRIAEKRQRSNITSRRPRIP